jgi:acyl-CoA thioester hydrolase
VILFNTKSLPLSKPITLKPEWIDYNGHVNMAYYLVMFDNSLEEFVAPLGLGEDYLKATNCSYFIADMKISYLRELKLTDKAIIRFRLIDYSDKAFHYGMELFHAEEHFLSAAMEGVSIHVDMAVKKATPVNDKTKLALKKMYVDHAGFEPCPHFGKLVGLRKK